MKNKDKVKLSIQEGGQVLTNAPTNPGPSSRSKSVSEYLDDRIQYLRQMTKDWPSDSYKHKCAQARLYELKALKKLYYPDKS